MQKSNADIYIDFGKVLSYPFLFAFLLSIRGGGKTYGFKKWAINSFLKKGNQFIYLRRYKSELKRINTYFNDIKDDFPNHELKVKGREFYIDNQIAGYAVTLSNAMTQKSVSFPKVDKICFDEFIIFEGNLHYLKDEVTAFLEFYETVARLRDNVKVIFCGNSITQVNPYFMYFNLRVKPNTMYDYVSSKYMLIVQYRNENFTKAKNKTKFGQLIKGTDYGNYSVENEFLLDDYSFIEKRTPNSQLIMRIKYDKFIIGFWYDHNQGVYYASNIHHPCALSFCVKRNDVSDMFYYDKNDYGSKLLKKIFSKNWIRYESLELKKILYDIFKTISL